MINDTDLEKPHVHLANAYALPHAERTDIKETKKKAKIPEATLITDNNPTDNNLINAEIIQGTEASSSKCIKASEESKDEKIIKDILNKFSDGLKTNANASDLQEVSKSYNQIKVAKDSFIYNLEKNQEIKKKEDVFGQNVFTKIPIENIFENELKKILYPPVEKNSLFRSFFSQKKKTILSTIFENELAGEYCSPVIQIRLPNEKIETENIFCIAKKIYNKVLNQSIEVYGGKNKKTKKRRKKQQKTKKKKTKQKKTKKKKTKRFSHDILKKRH